MAKHSRDVAARRPHPVVGVVALLLVLVLGIGAYFLLRGDDEEPVAGGDDDRATETSAPEPEPTQDPVDDAATTTAPVDCTPVSVWAAAEVSGAVEQAAERATTDCFTFEVEEREGAAVLTDIADGQLPDVWVPETDAWAHLAAQGGAQLEIGETVASSPVLFFTAPESAEALAGLVGPDGTFADLAGSYRELVAAGESPVVLRAGDPRVDAASMALLAGSREQAGGWGHDAGGSREILVRLAQATVPGDPLTAVQADPRAAVPATEQQAAAAQGDGLALSGLGLGDGAVVHIPFVRLAGVGSAEAADALQEALLSEDGVADLAALNLRPGADGPAPDVSGVSADVVVPSTSASAESVVQTAQTWAAVAPESRILAVVDISGSMQAELDGTTRIDLARTALQTAISASPEQTALGLWYFSTALDGQIDHVEVVPLRPLGEQADGQTQREVLLEITDDLGLQTLGGDTGLHDTLWAAYQEMLAQQGTDSIASVLLLTDGVDDDTTGGLSEDEVVALLTEAREASEIPVSVVLLGMGPEVDEAALQRLAEAAGGEFVLIRDPRELPQVFVDVVADRAP